MEIVTQGDVPNSVVIYSPRFVLFQASWTDQAHRLSSKKLFRASETGGDPAIAVWVCSIFHLWPLKKASSRLIVLPVLDRSGRGSALPQRQAVFRLLVLSDPHVLFCGGQVGCSAVFLAVQFEAVVPYSVTIPQ